MTWELTVVGLLIGVLAGCTGVGGGSLMTPILVLFLGFQPTVAIGTDLANGAIFKTAASIRHRRLGTVHARLTLWMLIGSAPASLGGVWLATYLDRTHGGEAGSLSARILAAALLLGGLGMVLRTVMKVRRREITGMKMTRRQKQIAIGIGIVGGFIVGLTSVGSGVFFALVMLSLFPLRSATVVGTDLAHAAALLWVAGAGHLVAGNVDLSALGWLLLGSVPGALIGASFTLRVPEYSLRLGLAVILVASGIALLEIPGGTIAAVVIAIVGIVVLLISSISGGRHAPGPLRRLAERPRS